MTDRDRDDSDTDRSAFPSGAVRRTARLASLPLGFAGRTTMGLGRRIAGRPADAVMTEVQRRTAEQIFSVLGELKGGAMKFGQAMSVFESALPEEVAKPYRETLRKLQDSAPPMSARAVHRVLARELGDDWRDKFERFDDAPAAAASIGQVHRARWHDGREVAVKVQYPGAARALETDLKQISRIARMFAVLAPGLEVKPLVQELRDRIIEELDYDLEAQAQQQFAEAFAGDPDIDVPEVLAHSSTVLVSRWLESSGSLAALIDSGTQEERDRFGQSYVRFLFAGPERVGLLHADPHPGNFRILDDGRLGVVDYGAVARLPGGSLPAATGRLLRAAVDDDYDAVVQGLRDEGFIRPTTKIDPDVIRDYLAPFVEPAQTDTFRFSRAWMREQFVRVSRPDSEGIGTAMKINMPPEYLLIHRVWVGGIGVLSQLEAEAPFRDILAASLPGFAD
ncbi:MAG: AarF/ABC1/UbiB kinase family protein [Nocardioidaceae bacterium]|nr:AarF/ABC1/UbiB kinase family protein [Nocardioidaceae bacterium]